ncbi:MAG: hypothetical protein IJ131_04490, partial [Eggerthellaceae bacterium]|nr:hypothetical protein [Eggerthellaceae bacterium]
ITYSLSEKEVADYTTTYNPNPAKFQFEVADDVAQTVELAITNTHEPATEIERTITYTYLTEDGTEASGTVMQKAKLKRTPKELDPETGEVLEWNDWTIEEGSDTSAVNSPDIDGYTPTMPAVPAWDIDLAADEPKGETVHVVYQPKAPTAEPALSKDGKYDPANQDGTVLQGQSGKPEFTLGTKTMPDGTDNMLTFKLLDEQGNEVEMLTVPNEGTYTIDPGTGEVRFAPDQGFEGKTKGVAVRGTDRLDQSAETTYTSIVVPNVETAAVERAVTYTFWDKDGNSVTASKTQSLSFTRVGTYDPAKDKSPTEYVPSDTSTIVQPDWTPQDMPAVPSPADEGRWVPTREEVEAVSGLTPTNATGKGFAELPIPGGGTKLMRTDNVPYLPQAPMGDRGETWGFPGEVQQKQAKDLFTITTPKTAADNDGNREGNEIVDVQLFDPDAGEYVESGVKVNAYFEGQAVGTYHYDADTGEIVFTPNQDFRASADPDPATVQGTDKNGLSSTVEYQPHFVPKVEEVSFGRTITYIYDDGEPVLDADGNPIITTQTVTFKREAVSVDPDTHEPVWGDWTPAAADLPEAASPAADRQGYAPAIDTVDAVKGLTEVDRDKKADKYPDVTVVYSKPPAAGEKKTYGGRGETQKGTPPFEKGSKGFTSFTLLDPKTGEPIDKIVVDGQGAYTLDSKTGEVTFVPEPDFVGPATTVTVRGTDANGYTADGTYTPNVVDNRETVTRTHKITYVYEDGSPVLDENGDPLEEVRVVDFEREGKVNPETGEVTWDSWMPYDLEEVVSPDVDGYTPDKAKVDAFAGTMPGNWPDDAVVTYKKNQDPPAPPAPPASTIWVTYIDDPDFSDTVYLPRTTQPKAVDGEQQAEPDAPADPTKDGYVFEGWERSVDADGNITYTAKWSKVPEPEPEPEPKPESGAATDSKSTPSTPSKTTPAATPSASVAPATPAATAKTTTAPATTRTADDAPVGVLALLAAGAAFVAAASLAFGRRSTRVHGNHEK